MKRSEIIAAADKHARFLLGDLPNTARHKVDGEVTMSVAALGIPSTYRVTITVDLPFEDAPP